MRCVTHWHILVHRPTLASKPIHQSLISFSMLDISWNNLPCFKRTERKAKCHTNLSPDYCNTLIVWSNKLGTNPYSYCLIHPHLSQIAAQIETKRRTGGVWGLWGHHEQPSRFNAGGATSRGAGGEAGPCDGKTVTVDDRSMAVAGELDYSELL